MVKKVLILFAGVAGTQVADILSNYEDVEIVGFLDGNPDLQGKEVFGKKVLGDLNLFENLFNEKFFDFAIISVGDCLLRKKFYEKGKELGVAFINAIDPSVKISKNVDLGEGNVLCGKVYIGNSTKIGNNNFISSNSSIEHHNIFGNHITTGPHFSTTGKCEVEDCVAFGMHVGLQYAKIGKDSLINSGIVVLENVPANSVLKKKKDYVVFAR